MSDSAIRFEPRHTPPRWRSQSSGGSSIGSANSINLISVPPRGNQPKNPPQYFTATVGMKPTDAEIDVIVADTSLRAGDTPAWCDFGATAPTRSFDAARHHDDIEVRGQIFTEEVVASRAEAVNIEGLRRVRIDERGWVSMVA